MYSWGMGVVGDLLDGNWRLVRGPNCKDWARGVLVRITSLQVQQMEAMIDTRTGKS